MDNQKWGNILEVLDARSSVDELAYVFLADGTSSTEICWTFADTIRTSHTVAAHLSGRGLGIGDRVILAVNPSLEYVAAFYGIMQLGAVPVPCFPPLRTKDFDRFLEITADCRPAGIVIDEMYRNQVEALQGRLESAGLTPIVVYADQAFADDSAVAIASPAHDELAAGRAQRSRTGSGTTLFSYGVPREPVVRIVDPDTRTEGAAGPVGEIWVHGDNVAEGYWQKPEETRADLRRAACCRIGSHTRRAVAADRRLGRHL
jgi:acyl-CoA synthetase (AMP-forming)/AMP-acid ligase II